METRDFKAVDRTGWPPGPWDDEPDRIEWIDDATGQPCLMKRNGAGAWCGYTAVNPDHPYHGINYIELPEDIDVHGTLTYSGFCHGEICHVPQPGEPDDVFWYGFDCNHSFDAAPALEAAFGVINQLSDELHGIDGPARDYRDVAYVREQVTNLARQLADAA